MKAMRAGEVEDDGEAATTNSDTRERWRGLADGGAGGRRGRRRWMMTATMLIDDEGGGDEGIDVVWHRWHGWMRS